MRALLPFLFSPANPSSNTQLPPLPLASAHFSSTQTLAQFFLPGREIKCTLRISYAPLLGFLFHSLNSFTLQIQMHTTSPFRSINAVCPLETCVTSCLLLVSFDEMICFLTACRAQHVIENRSADLRRHWEMRLFKFLTVRGCHTVNEISLAGPWL